MGGYSVSTLKRLKRHTHVLDKIKQLIDDTPKDFAEPNFRLCFKINQLQNGKPQAYYEITKDGFVLLAMGFTGKKAIEFKINYINALLTITSNFA